MNTFDFSIQGLFFIPFVFIALLFIYFRSKFYWFDDFFSAFDETFDTFQKKLLLYGCTIFLALVWGFIISSIVFPVSDVDEAMTGAIRSFFIYGINPYTNKVVPHILIFPTGTETLFGTYNYGPVDLCLYAIGYFMFSPFFGSPWWIYVTNIFLTVLIYLIIRTLVPAPETVKLLSFAFFFSWFLQDNVVLMCLFLALAWWTHLKFDSKYKYPIVIILLTLGVLTKLYIAFVLIGYFVYIFKKDIKLWIINGLIGGFTAVIVLLPFNIIDVIKSIFLFQVNITLRENYATIQGGIPSYLNLLGLDWLFVPLAILLVLLFLILSEKYAENQIELKFAIFTIINLVLLPSSDYAFFIIPSFFILVQYYKNHQSHNSKAIKT